MKKEFKLGEIVYHRQVYNHKEPLKIVGIRENELELEGDFSGGTHDIILKQWMPIKGTSRIYNHDYKERIRQQAICIETLAIPCSGSQDTAYLAMREMVNAVMILTSDVGLNPEY